MRNGAGRYVRDRLGRESVFKTAAFVRAPVGGATPSLLAYLLTGS